MPALVRRQAPGAPPLAARAVRALAERMLAALGLEGAELSVLLVDDARIQALNREHRGKDKPTDVLSFPQDGSRRALARARAALRRGEVIPLGDVVIALPTAARQAAARRRPLGDEVRFLLAHGLLHLVGHDHAEPVEAAAMRRETRRLVRQAAGEPGRAVGARAGARRAPRVSP